MSAPVQSSPVQSSQSACFSHQSNPEVWLDPAKETPHGHVPQCHPLQVFTGLGDPCQAVAGSKTKIAHLVEGTGLALCLAVLYLDEQQEHEIEILSILVTRQAKQVQARDNQYTHTPTYLEDTSACICRNHPLHFHLHYPLQPHSLIPPTGSARPPILSRGSAFQDHPRIFYATYSRRAPTPP